MNNFSDEVDYVKRKEEMWDMRHVQGMTLKEIGEKCGGISRERVRQIIGNTGRDFRSEWTKELIASKKVKLYHWTELGNAPGVRREWRRIWGNERHEVKSGSSGNRKGYLFEEFASEILTMNGIENRCMPYRSSFDILCENGAKLAVTVSGTDVREMPSQVKQIYPTWAVVYRNKNVDFLFAFVPDEDEVGEHTYYVIPISELLHLKTKDSRIRIPHPPMSQKVSKWHKFHKRLDLIKNYTV